MHRPLAGCLSEFSFTLTCLGIHEPMEEENVVTATATKSSSSSSSSFSSDASTPSEPLVPALEPPEGLSVPMEFLARSWSVSALEVSKAIAAPASSSIFNKSCQTSVIPEESTAFSSEFDDTLPAVDGHTFSFATSATTQLVLERIMSQSQPQQQDVSPRPSGRLSHSSGPLNGAGSFTDSPPLSPSEMDDIKFCRLSNTVQAHYRGKTVGRWFKDRREKKKEESRTHNAQIHAAVCVAGVAAAVAAMATATTHSSKEDQSKTDAAVASAATLVAAQCVEAAEVLGADREHLASVISSAVNTRTAGDMMTLTAAAATALRGVAALNARALKDVWNVAAVIPIEKAVSNSNSERQNSSSEELTPYDTFSGVSCQELLARGGELLKRTRKGDLHWKMVSVYIDRVGQVILKMKSRHVAGTITKSKKNVVLEVMKDVHPWPKRHSVEGSGQRRYFALRTIDRGVVEFECRNQCEYEVWTKGVWRLLGIAAERRRPAAA